MPVRVEVGPRDLAEDRVTLVRRIRGGKTPTPLAGVLDAVRAALVEDQVALYADAERARDARIVRREDGRRRGRGRRDRLGPDAVGRPRAEGEARLAERAVTVRCLVRADGSVPETGDEPDVLAYCARAY